ncbi:MAG: ABC transporter permease subunit [Candidatus Thermoplasmatota archaeon]|nr:ABC transporter permease subunit [Candidatus Thermoplasmatota archaeon]MBS3790540.1 ABC transporter permease subunit [Candidatus Thermoplasmatota archaeon]
MKIGKTMWMELKNRWKGFLLFILVVVLLVGGFVQAYPSFSEAFEDELEGSENIDIEVLEDRKNVTVKLSWKEIVDAENYSILVSESANMMAPLDRVDGVENTSHNCSLKYDEKEGFPERYFAVVAVIDEDEKELVGMGMNFERTSPFQEIWGVDYGDIQGFLSILWSTWWILLIGLYIGYISVNLITKDYEEERMDVLLSKPISRRQYLLEKFSIVSLYTLALLVLVGLVLVASAYSLGELNSVSSSALMISSVLSWPVFLVVISISVLAGVYLESSRKAVGVSFIFILIQYGVNMVGDLTEGLEYLKTYTIINYWNYEAALYGEAVSAYDVGFLLVLSAVLIVSALVIFDRKDIPV